MPPKDIGFAFPGSRPRWGHTAIATLSVLLVTSFLFSRDTIAAEGPGNGRVLTSDEGLALVEAITAHRTTLLRHGRKPDCSHLVNDVYSLAGFPYFYAKSSDLYRGHPSFVRVKSPQPGDLIVWRGHVGLVTDPRQHLFYSSLRSGLDVEDYTSSYWTRHGTPRFYRYRIMNDQPYLRAGAGERERVADANFKTLPARQSDESNEESLSNDGSGSDSVGAEDFVAAGINSSVPANILVTGGRDKPTVEQVSESLSRMSQSWSTAADARSLLRSPSTIVIFTELQVNRLQFKGNRGWAYVKVDSSAYMHGGQLEKTVVHAEEHWEMTRSKSGWTMLLPRGIVYLSRREAARIFAQHLARLSASRDAEHSNFTASEERHLASLLNGILNN
jgi:hypothetical protein